MRYICRLVILYCSTFWLSQLSGQGVSWFEGNWEATKQKAIHENKAIFVDVYTSWCAPCKKMDQSVFPDSTLGIFMNKHFISIKVDAEEPSFGASFAQKYDAGVFPSLLFLSPHGEILSSFIGMHTKMELMEVANRNVTLFQNLALIDKVKSELDLEYDKSALKEILGATLIHDFDGKEKLAMNYLDKISSVSEDDLRLVMSQISKMELPYLQRLAPLTSSLTYEEMYVRRNSKEWIKWKVDTEKAINENLELFKKEQNFSSFEATLEILKNVKGISLRQIDNLYLAYYKQNNLEQYRTFATYLVDEHIIPTRPEDVKKADEDKHALLHAEVMRDMRASLTNNESITIEDLSASPSPQLDSLSEIYSISRSIADQLFEISSDFFAFYEDDSSKRKASFWSSLALKYYPYDFKYFDNHIYILEAQGQISQAEKVKSDMKQLPWYQEMIKKVAY